jgi:peroxidase
LKEALAAGQKALNDREVIEETLASPPTNSPAFLSQKAVSTSPAARLLSSQGYVDNKATQYLATKFDFQRVFNVRSDIGSISKSNSSTSDLSCNPTKYRTVDGSCNNLKNPKWGKAMIDFRRILNPDYCDGISAPRCASDGTELPSAREISIEIHRPSYETDQRLTVMLGGESCEWDIGAS